ncbi:hypothetical protein GDO81_018622 [Engystomops pustulosus]|uniref:G-protein coupled receptors family 1 profile domain-containing protein n=1 Tax=Engystomops pustulosus TaxID=76066 RepID=A0AAV6YTX5_ENGPU|nr:hypothetical protein GDO81_018622 [Engystomops pustulosus]
MYILQKVAISLYSIIFIFGLFGNGLVIWIAGFRMKKTISTVWFLHLAIADFLCCLSIHLLIALWANLSKTPSMVLVHVLFEMLLIITISSSVLLLTAISIDRWLLVMWPFWTKIHRTQKLVRIVVAIIWVTSLISTGSVYYLYVYHVDIITNYNTAWRIHLVRLLIMFVIPFLIIVACYVTIFLKLRKSNRPQRSQRPYRIITAVILCFFICWAPYYAWPLSPKYYIYNVQSQIIITLIISLAYLNSCINPIIYVFMGQDFRHGFLKSIPFRIKEAISVQPDVQCQEQDDGDPAPTTDF